MRRRTLTAGPTERSRARTRRARCVADAPLLAKLTRPRLHAAFPRERLFQVLDANRSRPVAWIAGPPGAGKTTLAATWLEHRTLPGIWYQLDPLDSDPATFFHYLRLAADAAGAKGNQRLPLFTPESSADVSGFARRCLRELFATLPRDAVLTLDNFHEVASESALQRALAAACDEIPEAAQLLIISRTDPPAEFSTLIVRERLARVDPEMLKLSVDEAEGIAAARGAVGVEHVRELRAQCDGWAAGFTLLRERMRRTGLVNRVEQRGSMQDVFDYFMEQAFRDTSEENQDTLVRTAYFPRFTEAMAIEVSGNARAGELLDGLYRRHLFVNRRHGEEVTYEYHMLFRAFLRDQARHHHAPTELAELARRAATSLERAGLPEDAVQLLVEVGDPEGAAHLVEKLAPELVASGRGAPLRGWIEAVPHAERDRRPWLSYWFAAAAARDHLWSSSAPFLEGRAAFERAYSGFVRDGDRVGQAMAAVGVLETYFIELADMNSIRPWLRIVESVLRDEPPFPSPDVAAGIYAPLVAIMLWAVPDHPLYPACVERLDVLVRGPLDPSVKVTAGGQLVEHYAFAGLVRRGERIAAEIEPLVRDPAVSPIAHASWCLRSCRLDYVLGDFRAVRRKLEEGLAILLESAPSSPLVSQLYGLQADVALTLRDLAAVPAILEAWGSWFERRDPTPAARQAWGATMHWRRSKLAALQGDLDGALREIDAACSIVEEHGRSLGRLAYHVEQASMLLERGDLARARTIVERWSGMYPPALLPMQAFRMRSVSALVGAASADGSEWKAELRDGLRVLRELGVPVVVTTNALLARQLAELALSEQIETAYVSAWIRKVRLRPSSQDVPRWPWPVRVRTLGPFAVEVDDVLLSFTRKTPRKPLELLQALVAFGGRAVPSETLCSALWPDSEADDAEAALRVTLSRLRKLLRCEEAVVLRDGKLSLDEGLCWVDSWSLEHLSADAEARPRSGRGENLMELYRGSFLENEREEPWMLATRERLRRRFAEVVASAGQALEREGRLQEASALYRRALEREPSAGAIRQRIAAAHPAS
jgi:ATP/maltotriose-dependent transcriptional regulator MalT/DNA-binding SARP family transcriptional activator